MSSAEAQRARRKTKLKLKKCLWCPRRARKGRLCRWCKHKHRLARRAAWQTERSPSAKQYRCTECGELGHNARRHAK